MSLNSPNLRVSPYYVPSRSAAVTRSVQKSPSLGFVHNYLLPVFVFGMFCCISFKCADGDAGGVKWLRKTRRFQQKEGVQPLLDHPTRIRRARLLLLLWPLFFSRGSLKFLCLLPALKKRIIFKHTTFRALAGNTGGLSGVQFIARKSSHCKSLEQDQSLWGDGGKRKWNFGREKGHRVTRDGAIHGTGAVPERDNFKLSCGLPQCPRDQPSGQMSGVTENKFMFPQ